MMETLEKSRDFNDRSRLFFVGKGPKRFTKKKKEECEALNPFGWGCVWRATLSFFSFLKLLLDKTGGSE